MSIENWEHFFKPEVRSSGKRYYTDGKVSVSQPSDTEIKASIRGSTPVKISFKSPSMESSLIFVDCTCPSSKKGQLCKHIWAALLAVNEKTPEFFDEKKQIEKQTAVNTKQNDYRKEQYQKQKQRLKNIKQLKNKKVKPVELPEYVEAAVSYFIKNGFPMETPLRPEAIQLAKKKLSRIFHPDMGGSHKEIIELNQHTETLLDFIRSI